MDKVRFGIVGVGGMGGTHASYLNTLPNASMTALCDIDPQKREALKRKYEIPVFEKHQELLDSGLVDAIIIATPHYFHPPIALDAFAKGIHVLSEKPAAVTAKAARQLNATYEKKYSKRLKYGIMFQMRTSGVYRKIKDMVAGGELGEITRITWMLTDWYRTWAYYASGGWRATWEGEGGGTLINQNPHNLDLLQWLIGGMIPSRVTAVTSIAKTHPIETEDEVSAILEYPNGAIGHYMTSTGEAPGSNRLEIAGDRGLLVCEGGKLTFRRTRVSVKQHRETDPGMFTTPECWDITVPFPQVWADHKAVTQNFVNAILNDEPLIAPGVEGVRGLEIGNAMLMAGLTRQPVDLPMDGDAYEQFLKDLAKKYGGKKKLRTKAAKADMEASFKK